MSPPSYKWKSDSSQSDNPDPNLLILAYLAISSFNVNLTDDDISDAVGGSSSQQPIGVKKAKLKKKKCDDSLSQLVKTIKKENEKLVQALNMGDSKLDQNYERDERRKQNFIYEFKCNH